MKISLADFARRNGITYVTAHRWLKTGRITAVKEGKFWYLDAPEDQQVPTTIVYIPIPKGMTMEDECVTDMVLNMRDFVKRNRIASAKFIYEYDGTSKLEDAISKIQKGSCVILGPGAREHICNELGEKAGAMIVQALTALSWRNVETGNN